MDMKKNWPIFVVVVLGGFAYLRLSGRLGGR
jgi:hypothetical protein